MESGLSGKIALVTGASKGIGLAIAQGLAAEGVRVVMSARAEARLHEEAAKIGALAIPADVSQAGEIERLTRETAARAGSPDILIVNAGGPPPGGALAPDDAAWMAAAELTLLSAIRLARACIPGMRQRRWGRIVHVTSTSVLVPIPNLVLSNALRAAVTAFAKTLSTELAPDGITVNSVAPGATDTERIRQLYPDPKALEAAVAKIPAGRLAAPSEVAAAAVFLCSVPAAMITGQTLVVDGGSTGRI
ncbi:MAG: 3-oxoacyl-[acyl-carrier protein] reductase [Verrucomicrobia bacterium]|jgi:3-oxoacyl-[acyl-carrier protein] reductase|nr:MAG: 3-oxoacyl-[acyl-carrier protein] reductase [Verrucomicrobiota bacterium]